MQPPRDIVDIDLSWINTIKVHTENDSIEGTVFIDVLVMFCEEMLYKYGDK